MEPHSPSEGSLYVAALQAPKREREIEKCIMVRGAWLPHVCLYHPRAQRSPGLVTDEK